MFHKQSFINQGTMSTSKSRAVNRHTMQCTDPIPPLYNLKNVRIIVNIICGTDQFLT